MRIELAVAVGLSMVALAAPMQAHAQMRTSLPGWQLNLSVPQRAQTTLSGGEGMLWDHFRRTGLTLSARGSGELPVTVTIWSVKDGRLNGRWQSKGFTAASGERPVSASYLPSGSDPSLPALGRVASVVSARPMTVDKLMSVGSDVSQILPDGMARGTVLVIFVGPSSGGSDSSTSPLFARTEVTAD